MYFGKPRPFSGESKMVQNCPVDRIDFSRQNTVLHHSLLLFATLRKLATFHLCHHIEGPVTITLDPLNAVLSSSRRRSFVHGDQQILGRKMLFARLCGANIYLLPSEANGTVHLLTLEQLD